MTTVKRVNDQVAFRINTTMGKNSTSVLHQNGFNNPIVNHNILNNIITMLINISQSRKIAQTVVSLLEVYIGKILETKIILTFFLQIYYNT